MGKALPPGDYYALVSRAPRRPNSKVYAWTVQDALPVIPVPLWEPDPNVTASLAAVFATAYDRGRYARLIDYRSTPAVLRSHPRRAWAEKTARSAGRAG
jgi:hypothetical protein